MAEYCIGTAQFGETYGIANISGQPDQNEIDKIVAYTFENGIRYFDTAQSYGNSESVLGKAVEKLDNKDKVRIISKLSPDLHNGDPETIIESVRSSLKKLNVGSLYGFLAHRTETVDTESYSSAVNKLKEEGLVIKSGVAVYTTEEAKTALDNTLVEILQIPFNILDRRWVDEKIIEKAEERNVQLMFRSIFLQGLIFLSNGDLERQQMDWAKLFLDQFHKLVSETTLNPIELSFTILYNISGENIIIMGIDSFKQLQNNMKLIEEIKPDKKLAMNWWTNLPVFPEKLLNPSLWN